MREQALSTGNPNIPVDMQGMAMEAMHHKPGAEGTVLRVTTHRAGALLKLFEGQVPGGHGVLAPVLPLLRSAFALATPSQLRRVLESLSTTEGIEGVASGAGSVSGQGMAAAVDAAVVSVVQHSVSAMAAVLPGIGVCLGQGVPLPRSVCLVRDMVTSAGERGSPASDPLAVHYFPGVVPQKHIHTQAKGAGVEAEAEAEAERGEANDVKPTPSGSEGLDWPDNSDASLLPLLSAILALPVPPAPTVCARLFVTVTRCAVHTQGPLDTRATLIATAAETLVHPLGGIPIAVSASVRPVLVAETLSLLAMCHTHMETAGDVAGGVRAVCVLNALLPPQDSLSLVFTPLLSFIGTLAKTAAAPALEPIVASALGSFCHALGPTVLPSLLGLMAAHPAIPALSAILPLPMPLIRGLEGGEGDREMGVTTGLALLGAVAQCVEDMVDTTPCPWALALSLSAALHVSVPLPPPGADRLADGAARAESLSRHCACLCRLVSGVARVLQANRDTLAPSVLQHSLSCAQGMVRCVQLVGAGGEAEAKELLALEASAACPSSPSPSAPLPAPVNWAHAASGLFSPIREALSAQPAQPLPECVSRFGADVALFAVCRTVLTQPSSRSPCVRNAGPTILSMAVEGEALPALPASAPAVLALSLSPHCCLALLSLCALDRARSPLPPSLLAYCHAHAVPVPLGAPGSLYSTYKSALASSDLGPSGKEGPLSLCVDLRQALYRQAKADTAAAVLTAASGLVSMVQAGVGGEALDESLMAFTISLRQCPRRHLKSVFHPPSAVTGEGEGDVAMTPGQEGTPAQGLLEVVAHILALPPCSPVRLSVLLSVTVALCDGCLDRHAHGAGALPTALRHVALLLAGADKRGAAGCTLRHTCLEALLPVLSGVDTHNDSGLVVAVLCAGVSSGTRVGCRQCLAATQRCVSAVCRATGPHQHYASLTWVAVACVNAVCMNSGMDASAKACLDGCVYAVLERVDALHTRISDCLSRDGKAVFGHMRSAFFKRHRYNG
ncbi:hypothetical protein KIPB_003557 [Kipferlia bialata]|uniref:Uncharacterized protein n=1 Tax=Kipferlia bialata TaxID=797122 RepID=A0A9K3GH55_9EUKA|nr:hypothetical protein KIPB_003557 [Kipferlia bialata]|eukprot:g3557.t1